MIIIYLTRSGGDNADLSYNITWAGLWAYAEISFGIIVTCTLSLPKFIEAKGVKFHDAFSSFTRPFTSLTSIGSFGSHGRSDKNTITREKVTRADTTDVFESNLSSTIQDEDVEGNHPHEDTLQLH